MESISRRTSPEPNALAAIRRFTRRRQPMERCDLCAAPIGSEHQHLLEPPTRQIVCACDACAILFSGGAETRYRLVPRRIEYWIDFTMTDLQWAGLGVPIALAFFLYSTPHQQVIATYPSPVGPAEAMLPADAWQTLADQNAGLATLEPDVEALLVNRVNGGRECYRAPIDECLKLVGLIRMHWRGLSGGGEVWKQIPAFFETLKSRSTEASAHA